MIKVKVVWSNFNVSLGFSRLLFGDWHTIPTRFFEMVYSALSDTIPVKSNEFSVMPANQLSEVRARYSIYGGRSAVTISPDAILFEFPSIVAGEVPIAEQISGRLHDAFTQAFPEVGYATASFQIYQHLEFVDPNENPAIYLTRFAFPLTREVGASVVLQPSGKCDIIAPDQSWQCSLFVERSLPNARAVFVAITLTVNKVEQYATYNAKTELVRAVVILCRQLLDLESDNAAG